MSRLIRLTFNKLLSLNIYKAKELTCRGSDNRKVDKYFFA